MLLHHVGENKLLLNISPCESGLKSNWQHAAENDIVLVVLHSRFSPILCLNCIAGQEGESMVEKMCMGCELFTLHCFMSQATFLRSCPLDNRAVTLFNYGGLRPVTIAKLKTCAGCIIFLITFMLVLE